jgi:hypothetical protein
VSSPTCARGPHPFRRCEIVPDSTPIPHARGPTCAQCARVYIHSCMRWCGGVERRGRACRVLVGLGIGCACDRRCTRAPIRFQSSRPHGSWRGSARHARARQRSAILCATTLWHRLYAIGLCRTAILRATLHAAWHASCDTVYDMCDVAVLCSTRHVLCAARHFVCEMQCRM